MTLDVSAALRSPGAEFSFESAVNLPDQVVMGETIRFPTPAVITGTFMMADEELLITGRLHAQAHAACARCLKPVVYQVDVPVEETFRREESNAPTEDDPWEERQVFTGKSVDLEHLAFTLALLDLPIRFLCDRRCAGLPGGSLGDAPLTNEETLADAHPFAALKQLITKDQEE